ncbi:MAG: hypothetical protein PF569_08265 [Candidatus Woesearchaeota archaeon]|nr:hypothetical protein [Candidatus Woesearchaeota archaeon]
MSKSMNPEDKAEMALQENDYQEAGLRLIESWEKKDGMELGNGVIAEMADKNIYNAMALVKFLENTDKSLNKRLNEYQTSSYMGVTPQEIVKVFRFSYGNSIAPELFNFWAMDSVKDSFFKIENKYTATKRGATEGDTTYESYGDGGRYPTSFEEDTITGDNITTNFTGTLPTVPLLPYSVKVFGPTGIIAIDDGNGNLSATTDLVITGTIDYTTGAFDYTFGTAPATGLVFTTQYNFDLEQETLFDEITTLSLDIVPYDFKAKWHSMEASWHTFAEEVSESKLGRSVRQDLLDSISDTIRKSQDEFFCKQATRQAGWATAITFDTDFSAQGADSDYANAQALFSEFENSRTQTYDALGRFPARTNLLVGAKSKAYLRKLKGYTVNQNKEEIGFFRDGDVAGYSVYVAPSAVVATDDIYLIGKGKDSLSTDAVVSVGMYKGEIRSDELTFSNFKNALGFGMMMDHKIMNRNMVTRIHLSNL